MAFLKILNIFLFFGMIYYTNQSMEINAELDKMIAEQAKYNQQEVRRPPVIVIKRRENWDNDQ